MSYLSDLKNIFTQDGSADTPEGAIHRAGGRHITNTVTLSANNASESINVFQITGLLSFGQIHGEILDTTTLVNCTNAYFDLWDGTLSTPLTKTTGTDFSGEAVGTSFVKTDVASIALTKISNATGAISEIAGKEVSQEFYAVQKNGANTYIRFNYTTTDTPINAQLVIEVTYKIIDGGTIVAV